MTAREDTVGLHDQLRELEEDLGIVGNERVREVARNVAGLMD